MSAKKGDALKTAFDVYTVVGARGSGGAGEVYEVRDSDGGPMAAKILRANQATTERLKRFKNEVNFCRKNTHGNIVRVTDTGITDNGESFYVMPLYSGTLRHVISQGIPTQDILPYFGHVLDGVEAAHLQGVWHRDIKPENILFLKVDSLLVVADFGIAHFEEEALLTAVETKNDERLANFLYSAPEQRLRGHVIDSKADIFALGLILNEMFTGAVPQGTSFRRIADVSTEHAYLDGIVELMIRQDPASRPTVAEVKHQLIARGNEFMSLQRLNSMRAEVIPESEVDDPFIKNPVRLVSVDYQNGRLIFELSAAPPQNWIMAFQNPRASQWASFQGSGPQNFSFSGNRTSVQVLPSVPHQQLVDYTKSYIDLANRQYAERVTSEHRKRLNHEREIRKQQIAEEERRQKILGSLRI